MQVNTRRGTVKAWLAGSALALTLGGCAAGTPAPIVAGQNQLPGMAGAPRSATMAAPVATPRAPQVAARQAPAPARSLQVAPPLQEEELEQLEPAAGPTASPPTVPQAAPPAAVRFETPQPRPAAARAAPVAPAEAPAPAPVAVAAEANGALRTHTVAATDTLFAIARTYETTPQAIVAANNLQHTADITPGQQLLIPQGEVARPVTPGGLAQRITAYLEGEPPPTAAAPVPTAAAPAAAPELDVAQIEPAAGSRVPANLEDTPIQAVHKVRAGETIYRLSRQYNVSVFDIMAANDLDRPEALLAGAELKIPRTGGAEGETLASVQATPEPETNTPVLQRGTDTANTAPPLREPEPPTETARLQAELQRGKIDRDAAKQKGFIWPVRGKIVKAYGERGNGVANTGINIEVPENTPVLASEAGTVLYAADGLRAYGNLVLIRHANGKVSAYGHNSHLLVRKGERVQKGQVIALSGRTGNVEAPQLHFEMRRNAAAVNPLTVLPKL